MRRQFAERRAWIKIGLIAALFFGVAAFVMAPESASAEGESWQPLQNQISNISGTGTITLQKDWTATADDTNLVIPAGKTVTLNLNGHTLDRGLVKSPTYYRYQHDGSVIVVYGNLILNDSTGKGKITGGLSPKGPGVAVHGGSLVMNGGTITNNHAGEVGMDNVGATGPVHVDSEGRFQMKGGTICNNSAYRGGGVCIYDGTFDMFGGKITKNWASECGGVYVYQGTFNMSGGEISDNTSDVTGVELWDDRWPGPGYGIGEDNPKNAVFNLTGGTITGTGEEQYYAESVIRIFYGEFRISGNPTVKGTNCPEVFLGDENIIDVTGPLDKNLLLRVAGGVFIREEEGQFPVTRGLRGNGTIHNFCSWEGYSGYHGDRYGVGVSSDGEAVFGLPVSTLTFKPGTGSGGTVTKKAIVNVDYIIPDNMFTPPAGAEFKGWSFGSDSTVYAPGEKVTINSEKKTLTARYECREHSWGAWTVVRKANALTQGLKRRVCVNDPSHVQEQVIPATGVSGTLLTKMTASGSKSLKVSWSKVGGAEGYDIFFSRCNVNGKEATCKKVKTIKGNKTFKWTKSGLKKQTAYKVYVKAYAAKNGKKTYIRTSPTAHAFTTGYNKTYTNAKALTVSKTAVTLKKGKTFKIKGKVTKLKPKKKLMAKGHAAVLRYLSSNKKVAVVGKTGKITAKGKGTCTVYVFTHNGISKSIKVTVK